MKTLVQAVRHFLLAIQFFTRLPVTGRLAEWVGYSPAMLRASAGHFPGVGLLVGMVAAAVFSLVSAALPASLFSPLIAAALSTVATVLMTGGFHEDGLADVADGLGGSLDRARALEIMKDSRVGAFGAMALVLALLTKVGLLAMLGSVEGLPEGWFDWTEAPFASWYVAGGLIAAHSVSRALSLVLIAALPHVGDTAASRSKPLADQISPASLLAAFLWCFMALALAATALDASYLIAASSFSFIAMLWMGSWFKRRLQGFTGDCLGATQQVCEIAFYLGLAVCL